MQIPIESINLLMLNVGFSEHNGDWNWQNVTSPFTRIYYVTKGSAILSLPTGEVQLTPRHLYIIPAYTTHSYKCSGRFDHYYLHAYEGFKKETDVFDFYDFPVEVDSEDIDEQVFARMCRKYPFAELPASDPATYDNTTQFTDYVQRYNDLPLYDKMQLRGSILMLFSRFMQAATPRIWTKDDRMKKVLMYIHNNIYSDIDIDDLASVACITKPYLIRLFTGSFGISPLQYINKKKIERAQLMLVTTDKTVMDIAYKLGYSDHSYFTRLFRKMTGSTPLAYRKRMQ